VALNKLAPIIVGPCGFYLGWLIYRNNMLQFSERQLENVGERYSRLISSMGNHDPEWVELSADKYKSLKLTFEVMYMEINGMLKQLEVLHWWRLSGEVKNRVAMLEAELCSCKERLRYLQGEDSDLLRSCLTIEIPSSPIQPITQASRQTQTESTLREVSQQALKYFTSRLGIETSVEIRIGSGTGVGVENKVAYVQLDPNENSLRNVLEACAIALYRNHHLGLYREKLWPEFQVVTRATPRSVMEHAVGRFLAEDIVKHVGETGIDSESVSVIEAEADFWENLDWNAYQSCEKNPYDLEGIVGISGLAGNELLSKLAPTKLVEKPFILSSLSK